MLRSQAVLAWKDMPRGPGRRAIPSMSSRCGEQKRGVALLHDECCGSQWSGGRSGQPGKLALEEFLEVVHHQSGSGVQQRLPAGAAVHADHGVELP